jgi:H+/Cl- antiporter ClcA
MTSFTLWVLILAALLFLPVSKLIWVLSVRRLQRKTGRELSEEELHGQLKRARVIAVFVALIFSILFNANLMGIPHNG